MILQDQVAIITGATSGIGRATAVAMAKEGAKVLICGRDERKGQEVKEEIGQLNGEAVFCKIDLLDPEAPEQAVGLAARKWGRIDIVVNNAAMICNKPMEEVTRSDWDQLLDTNLKAPFFLVQHALTWLKRSKGCVVNVSSINSVKNDYNNLVYDAIKAALNHMTSGMALDLREHGIRCNAILPAGVDTPLLNKWLHQKFNESPNQLEQVTNELQRDPAIARPEQIADAIVFLASDKASWVNGAHIRLDGGYTIR